MCCAGRRMVRVSVAIRAFRSRWLGEAIASVLQQTFRDLELIIYDDSGDLRDFVSRFDDSRIRYVRAAAKQEASGRFMAAIALCRGAHIGLLDDDDRYEPRFIDRMTRALDENPRAGAAVCRAMHVRDGASAEASSAGPPGPQQNVLRWILEDRWAAAPSATLFRREAIQSGQKVQPMPDGVSPDVFINATIALAGWTHVIVDETLVSRTIHRDQISGTLTCANYAVATFEHLRIDDRELDGMRRRELARRKLIRHAYRLLGPPGMRLARRLRTS